jgi:hypothetical protein
MACFDIVLQTSSSLHPDGDPSDFISEYLGFIQCYREGDSRVTRVGRAHAYKIHADRAADQGELLFDVCDAHSQSMHDLYSVLCDPEEDDIKEEIRHQFDGMDSDILVLDYVLLHPKWRGLKLGLLVVRKMVDLLGGGSGLAVAEILPLRHEAHEGLRVPASWIHEHGSLEERKEATRRLRRYFRSMGFQRIGKTPYYGLSLARKTPTAEELLRPSGEPQA